MIENSSRIVHLVRRAARINCALSFGPTLMYRLSDAESPTHHTRGQAHHPRLGACVRQCRPRAFQLVVDALQGPRRLTRPPGRGPTLAGPPLATPLGLPRVDLRNRRSLCVVAEDCLPPRREPFGSRGVVDRFNRRLRCAQGMLDRVHPNMHRADL
jgi:hypothetical protein